MKDEKKTWPGQSKRGFSFSLVISRETAAWIVLLNGRRASFERIFKIARLILSACVIVFSFAARGMGRGRVPVLAARNIHYTV